MKTVLVLTDFSPPAQNAAEAGLRIASKMQADLVLMHVHPPVSPIISTPGAGRPTDYTYAWQQDYTDKLRKEAARLKSLILKDQQALQIKQVLVTGDLSEHAVQLSKQKAVALIIMGSYCKEKHQTLFGNEINNVMKVIKKPLLIVPITVKKLKIETITFPTDLADTDLRWIKKLAGFFQGFAHHITVLHISKPVIIADFGEEDRTANFMADVAKLGLDNVSYRTLRGDNINEELDRYNGRAGADMMAMVYKRHNMLWRLLFKSHCKIAVDRMTLPLLIFPE